MTVESPERAPRPEAVRVVIAEDETLAARHLERLIAACPALSLVGTASDGQGAVELLAATRPEVLFLDVQLPILDGLQVLAALDFEPHVVFTTAYEAHAVTAFQLGALDYLLKPFTEERFHDAVERIMRALAMPSSEGTQRSSQHAPVPHRVMAALQHEGYITRLFVRERQAVRPVLVAQIERAEADGDYTALIVGGRRLLAYVSLNDLNAQLDPAQFLRIHRSHIVNLDFVGGMEWYDGTRLQIRMLDGTRLLASRTRSRELRRLIL